MGSREAAGIELRHLRYFLAVAQELSFTRAAERLFVSQPALSIAIRQLEDAVGVQLLRRTTRQVELTAAGEAFRRSAAVTLAHLERSVRHARGAAQPAPLLRVNLPYESNGTGRDVLRRLRLDHPGLTVERHTLGSGDVHAGLLDGRLDVAIGGAFDRRDGIVSELVRTEPLVAVLPPLHDLARQPAVSLRDLVGQPLYIPSERDSPTWYRFVLELFGGAGVQPELAQTDQGRGPVVFVDLVSEGGCFALGVASDEFGPRVATRPLTEEFARYPWSVLWLADDPSTPLAWFLAAARAAAREHHWLPGTYAPRS